MKKEKCECEEVIIKDDPRNTLSDAERYRLDQARVMLLKMGYAELPDGSFIEPSKDGKKQK